MGLGIRAVVAALLIAVFYVLLAAVTWFGVVMVHDAVSDHAYSGSRRVFAACFGLLFVVPAVRVVVAAVRRRAPGYPGVEVTRDAQPELWGFIEALAAACRVPTPTRIVVTGQADAAAESSAALFGTVRRERTVYLGLPLLAVLDTAQAAAVVCHELGHHARGESRLSALTYRSGDALVATVVSGGMRGINTITDALFRAFAGLYFSVTFALRRRQELAADALAARVAGTEATAAALEALPLIGVSHVVYIFGNESGPIDGGLDPAADLPRFRDFYRIALAEVTLADEEPRRRFDSHPPIAERVAAVRRTDNAPAVSIPSGPALDLVRTPETVAVAAAEALRSAR
ncbi:M48 family metallopeptidase [Catenulispora sp. NL8]|uniref:M48 family metallopeptidase n=1 Tax=Catenulispora pinistramenti TaxID=2705254 RepID=A0ABS5KVQ6_9ACTN|nr:M48 family metallopeptidase [Catenulispora pinistramenti]MBS2550126.1 M48 family metallopeptidase [Catenulispora pinistramenti]